MSRRFQFWQDWLALCSQNCYASSSFTYTISAENDVWLKSAIFGCLPVIPDVQCPDQSCYAEISSWSTAEELVCSMQVLYLLHTEMGVLNFQYTMQRKSLRIPGVHCTISSVMGLALCSELDLES